MVSVHIVYQTCGSSPVTAGSTEHRGIIEDTARTIVAEAKGKAQDLEALDSTLAKVQAEEAERTRRVMAFLVPEIADELN
jgi:hypothetical protein